MTDQNFIQLAQQSPLTLRCSALADFLWEDYVRDANPVVSIVEEHYKTPQISRFGKEIFDRLYNTDQVDWLISLDDYESYFRSVADGQVPALPEGYKPENAFWFSIMSSLSESPTWIHLLQISAGDQYNAGNNAVNILNRLASYVERMFDEAKEATEMLLNSGAELNELREKYQQAMKDGDQAAANAARAQGKELVQKINNALGEMEGEVKQRVDKIVNRVFEDAKEQQQTMNALWGATEGEGLSRGDVETKKKLAAKLKSNKILKKLAKSLGSLRRIWKERKNARLHKTNYAVVAGAKFGADVSKVFPTELALAASPQGRALFALKHSQRTLLTKDFEYQCKNVGLGSLVMYIDTSGSMQNDREIWSKSIAIMLATELRKSNRKVYIHLFDARVAKTPIEINETSKLETIIDKIADWGLGGGTQFNPVVEHALSNPHINKNADVLMITDGESEISQANIKALNKFKATNGVVWNTVCVLETPTDPLIKISDNIHYVDPHDKEDSIKIFENLRGL